jgi:hypothetical protein
VERWDRVDWSDDMCERDLHGLQRILRPVLVIGCGELKPPENERS